MSDLQQKNQNEEPFHTMPSQQQENSAIVIDQTWTKGIALIFALLVGVGTGSIVIGGVGVSVVAAAAIISRLKARPLPFQSNRRKTSEAGNDLILETKDLSQNEKQCLALVVGADAESLCKKLKEQESISQEDWKEIYDKTQDLLLKDEFLDPSSFTRESTASEYSVYIISIHLDWSRIENAELIKQGFEAGASSLDREDAFEQLPHIAREVKVSQCLPPTSYQGQGFYQC